MKYDLEAGINFNLFINLKEKNIKIIYALYHWDLIWHLSLDICHWDFIYQCTLGFKNIR